MIDIQKTIIEIQYYHGYSNSVEMIDRVREVLKSPDMQIEYQEILIDTPEQAQKRKFRGSSTLLINGRDMEILPEPDIGSMVCPYYKDGIPSTEILKTIIKNKVKEMNQT